MKGTSDDAGCLVSTDCRDESPKDPMYLHSTKYGFCSRNFRYGLGKQVLCGT